MSRYLIIGILFILIACRDNSKVRYGQFINECYSFSSEDMQMDINFDIRNDTVFILYAQALDNGRSLNAYIDKTDYAGFFLMDNLSDSVVTVQIKNYIDEEDVYKVNLKFTDMGKFLLWNINSLDPIAYLPKELVFESCKD